MGHRSARTIHTTMIFHTCPQYKCEKRNHTCFGRFPFPPLHFLEASHGFFFLTLSTNSFQVSSDTCCRHLRPFPPCLKGKKTGALFQKAFSEKNSCDFPGGLAGLAVLLVHQVVTLGSKATSQCGTAFPGTSGQNGEMQETKMLQNMNHCQKVESSKRRRFQRFAKCWMLYKGILKEKSIEVVEMSSP